MENPRANAVAVTDSRESLALAMENPFSLKFGQVFTGFGVGCGVGIGVGRPIYLGAIPMLQQVMSATRGATDAVSGVGQHVNSSLRKLGMKNIEAGVGCGVGIGHGFGAGIALKPGVVNRIQSSVMQAVTKLASNMGLAPSLSSMQSVTPGSVQSSINALTSTSGAHVKSSPETVADMTSTNFRGSIHLPRSNESPRKEPTHNSYEPKGTSDGPLESRTEKVIDSFLQSPIFNLEENAEVNEMAEKLRSENNVLQVLLRQQQAIQGLMEENQKLQKILVEDLKVPPIRFRASSESSEFNYPCSDCFECRRRRRKGTR